MTNINLFKHVAAAKFFPTGAIIFEEGELGNVMYVIEEGEVEIMVGDKIVDRVRAGGIFGEMALISDLPRSGTAVAKTPCKLIPFDEQKFKLHVQLTPTFSLQVMRSMANRMHTMSAQLEFC